MLSCPVGEHPIRSRRAGAHTKTNTRGNTVGVRRCLWALVTNRVKTTGKLHLRVGSFAKTVEDGGRRSGWIVRIIAVDGERSKNWRSESEYLRGRDPGVSTSVVATLRERGDEGALLDVYQQI